jgi:hypothetical protein
MTTKTKPPPRPAAPRAEEDPLAGFGATPPWTTEERLQHIQAMIKRINGYAEYISQVANLSGTSAEAKDKAVAAFYERMVILERQLRRIQEELHLG